MAIRTPAFALLAGAACTGPALHLDNPSRHPTFVDGVAVPQEQSTTATRLPFRYYGTTRVDALPADRGDRSDFSHEPASTSVEVEPALTSWLFPFDFPVDVMAWLVRGPQDHTATVAVTPVPPSSQAELGSARANAEALLERARAARLSR